MLLLLYMLLLRGASSSTVPSTTIIVPSMTYPPEFNTCSMTPVNVQFHSFIAGDVVYKRQVVSADDQLCMSSIAVKLNTTKFSDCAKIAASKAFNSFYFDDQNECWASNYWVSEATVACSGQGVVVYFSDVRLSNFTLPTPTITTFTVTDPKLGESFTVNYVAPCSKFFNFTLNYGSENLGIVMSGQVISYNVPPCTTMTFTLTPSFGETSGAPVNADCITPDIPDVDNLSIDTFVFTTSFVVHFTPTCPGVFTYNLLKDGSSVQPDVQPDASVSFAVQPCTTYSTFTLQPVNPNGTDAGPAISVPTVTTPKLLVLNAATVVNVTMAEGLKIHVDMYDPCSLVSGIEVRTPSSSATPIIHHPSSLDIVVSCSQTNDFSSFTVTLLTTEPYTPVQTKTVSNVNNLLDGMTITPFPAVGKCYAYEGTDVTQAAAKAKCESNCLRLINSREMYLLYRNIPASNSYWIGVKYTSSWTWDWPSSSCTPAQNVPAVPPVWQATYPTSVSQPNNPCAYHNPNTASFGLKNVPCTSVVAGTVCII
ncbi:uncharacterized protein LOC108665718 [Hyalella azteca]|uniref:Uncharacterized protein LOC108665718 n=1 Tax=Hyalella azteca TaxID=294128 RepID=A0A8B7N3M5_HYAAZ|nr:uncharacterized protein LOC108665718 [Hyalella azteca]